MFYYLRRKYDLLQSGFDLFDRNGDGLISIQGELIFIKKINHVMPPSSLISRAPLHANGGRGILPYIPQYLSFKFNFFNFTDLSDYMVGLNSLTSEDYYVSLDFGGIHSLILLLIFVI